MHIVEGVLSVPILASGAVITAAGVGYGLKKIQTENIPTIGLMSTLFFVVSLISLPVGFSSVHLILNGLIGLTLGWMAFPALVVALLLQAVFFGFGGLIVLGVNTLNIALPAIIVHYLFKRLINRNSPKRAAIWGAMAGGMAIALTSLMVSVTLALNGDAFLLGAKVMFIANLPVILLESAVTGAAVSLLRQVKPDFIVSQNEPA